MNYKYVILTILFLLGIGDCMAYNRPRLQKQLFNATFIFLYLSTIICYYFGGDIAVYHEHFYITTPTLPLLLTYPDCSYFEPGYRLLVSCMRTIGGSLYALCIITWTAFYLALWKLFKTYSKAFQTFALMIFMCFCWDWVIYAIRQTWAVTAFFSIVLLMRKKKYVGAIIIACAMSVVHRSALPFIAIFTITWLFARNGFSRKWIVLLFAILIAQLFIVPTKDLIETIMNALHFTEGQRTSVGVLIIRGRTFAPALLLYATFFYCAYKRFYQADKIFEVCVLTGCIFITGLYRYVGLLIRFQYFFMPFLAIALMNNLYAPSKHPMQRRLARQVVLTLFIAYWGLNIRNIPKTNNEPALQLSTIFERRNYSAPFLQARQLQRAENSRENIFDFKESKFVTHTQHEKK